MIDPLNIGIVACSAEGAALCYRDDLRRRGGAARRARASRDLDALAAVFALQRVLAARRLARRCGVDARSANRLASIGADFLICPDNTIHQALPIIESRSPLPWMHIAEIVANEAAARGFRRVGLTERAGSSRATSIPRS